MLEETVIGAMSVFISKIYLVGEKEIKKMSNFQIRVLSVSGRNMRFRFVDDTLKNQEVQTLPASISVVSDLLSAAQSGNAISITVLNGEVVNVGDVREARGN